MKKIILCSILIIFLFVIVACSKETITNNTSDEISIISMQDIPTPEEIQTMSHEDIYDIKLMAENISLEESEIFFKKETENFLIKYENVNLKGLSITKDNLSIIKGQNNKSLFNLIFKIDVVIDTSNMIGSAEYATEILKQLSEFYWEYGYFNLKAKKLYISAYDLNGNKINEKEVDIITGRETVFINQSQDELYVQTLAYNMATKIKDVVLQKFGVVKETKELYIEYYLEDSFFIDNKEIENSIVELERIADELKYIILSDKEAQEFVNDNNVKVITISFNNINIENSYITFNYPL